MPRLTACFGREDEMPHSIVAFGEVLWDLLPSGRFLGGAPFNFVYRVASIGDRGVMISRLGEDDLGREAFSIVQRLGMDTRCIQWDRHRPTGTVPITFAKDGAADITILPNVAYDYIEPAPEAREVVAQADCLCFGTLIQRRETSRRTLQELLSGFRGRIRLLDLNLRRDCWTSESVRSSIEHADVLKLNDGEAATLAGLYGLEGQRMRALAAGLLAKTGLSHVVVTLGESGAVAAARGGESLYDPAYEVKLVDPLGAGDAFAAGFVHGLLEGWPLERSVRLGNALGACVAEQRGATEPLAMADAERMMRERRQKPPDPRFA
jgi:fructokinase